MTTRVLTIIVAVAALTLLYAVSRRSLGFGTMEGAMNAGSQWPAIGSASRGSPIRFSPACWCFGFGAFNAVRSFCRP